MSHFLCLVAHPFLHVDALAECHLQVGNELLHASLSFGREVLGHIELTECFAKAAFDSSDGTFPARTILLLAAQHLAVETEVEGAALVVDEGRCHVHGVPEIDVLQGFGRLFLQNLLYLMDSNGLTEAHFLYAFHA